MCLVGRLALLNPMNNLIARPRLHSNRIHVTFIMRIKHEKLPIESRHVDVTILRRSFSLKTSCFGTTITVPVGSEKYRQCTICQQNNHTVSKKL